MPRTPTDYSKSVIYKIEHLEKPELVYVGSTTNFIRRKSEHKTTCNNKKNEQYNQKLYTMIRCNGGFESFKIMIICEFPCNNKTELVIEEEKYRKELQASLNSVKAYRTIDEKKENDKLCDIKYKKNHKPKIKDYNQEYYTNNKDKYQEFNKKHYELNKEFLKEKITCECGSIIARHCKKDHEKRIKHCQFIQSVTLPLVVLT